MHTAIKPVAVFPTVADDLYLRPGSLGTPPSFYWELRKREVVPSAGLDADGNPLPETEQFRTLTNGNASMTDKQWDAWSTAADDEQYMLSCIAANLGLEIIAPS